MELEKEIYDESNGFWYRLVGDYYLPNIKIPDKDRGIVLGKYGMMRKRFLEENDKLQYYILMTKGELMTTLHETEMEAKEMLDSLIASMAESEGVTEKLKAEDQMLWVQKMNNIRNRAEEIVCREIIYAEK